MPTIELTPIRVVCARHGEVFRAKWPEGYPIFATIALECFLSQPDTENRIYAAVHSSDNTLYRSKEENDIWAVNHLLSRKPLCCQIPPLDLYEVYLEVGRKTNVWENAKCSLCGRFRPGAPYRKVRPNSTTMAPAGIYPHVCLACVCGLKRV